MFALRPFCECIWGGESGKEGVCSPPRAKFPLCRALQGRRSQTMCWSAQKQMSQLAVLELKAVGHRPRALLFAWRG